MATSNLHARLASFTKALAASIQTERRLVKRLEEELDRLKSSKTNLSALKNAAVISAREYAQIRQATAATVTALNIHSQELEACLRQQKDYESHISALRIQLAQIECPGSSPATPIRGPDRGGGTKACGD